MMKVPCTCDIIGYILIATTLIFIAVGGVSGTFITQPSRCTLIYAKTRTHLAFGIPSFLTPQTPNDNDESNKKKKDGSKIESKKDDEKSVGLKGLVQLVMAGAGAPFLGDFEGVEIGRAHV